MDAVQITNNHVSLKTNLIVATSLRIDSNRGHFAVLPLRRDDSLVVISVPIHDIYLSTQLRTIYIGITIVEIYPWTDM